MKIPNSIFQKTLAPLQIIYNTNIIILLIILLSFFLHLNILFQLADNSPYFFNIQRQTDQEHYINSAEALLNGTWPQNTPFSLSPYYSYYLAGTFLIHQDHFTPRLFQIFLGILVVVFTYKIASLVFSRHVGIVSALAVAVYGPLIFYNMEYTVVSHMTLFIMNALYLTLIYGHKKQRRIVFTIGFLLGLATIGQPQSIVLIFPSALWIIKRDQYLRSKMNSILTLVFGLVFVLAFPIIHNWQSTGQFTFITTTGAYNLYIGNNPDASATFMIIDPELKLAVENKETSYFAEVIDFISQAPNDWLFLMVKKAAFMTIASDAELGSNFNYHYWGELFSSTLHSLSLRYELLILTVLTTLHLLIRNRKTWTLYLYIVSYYSATIIIFVTARFRVPLTPVLIILAVGALFEIVKRIKQGDYKVIVLLIAILISYIAVMIRFNLWLESHTFI